MCVGIDVLRESLGVFAARFDAASLSAAEAEFVVGQASRIEKMAAMLKALAAGRLAETGTWRVEGERSAAHHLARRTGTSVIQAASAIDTARRLGALPEVCAAALGGELSVEQASAIADAAGSDVAVGRRLLETARCAPLAGLREECARSKAAGLADSEARRVRIHGRRSLRCYTDAEGEWHLHCRNNLEVGARIMAVVDSLRDAMFRQARSEGRHESPDAYAADALAEMARRAVGGEAAAESAARPKAPARTGPPKVIVRVDLEALLRGYATDGQVCEIAGFGPVAASAVRDMIDTDDPFLTAVVTRGQKIVGVAHLGRRPNAAQQTALQWLYPSCANQACSAQARLDYDHRVEWSRSHITVFDLLDRLCHHCHALKTRQNWSLVGGRGKRPLVPPEDPRHPRNAGGGPRPPPAR